MLIKGTKIVKVNSKPGDAHQDGDKGVVHARVQLPEVIEHDGFNTEGMYQVIWEDFPGVPVLIADYRVKEDKS